MRGQYAHVSDITPTVLEVLGAKKPESVKGVHQEPFTGTPFTYTFDDAAAPARKRVQYYEIWGNRSIYKDGWVAVVNHIAVDGDYSRDRWELYHVAEDFSEAHDVAAEYPDKLRELEDEFLVQAAQNNVFPMLEIKRHLGDAYGGDQNPLTPSSRKAGAAADADGTAEARSAAPKTRVFRGVVAPIGLPEALEVNLERAPFTVRARIERRAGGEGAIFSAGGRFGGFALFVQDGHLGYAYSDNLEFYEVRSGRALPEGTAEVGFTYELVGEGARVQLRVSGEPDAVLEIPERAVMFGWGIYLGSDPHTAVSRSYDAPFAFEGEIDELVLTQGDGDVADTPEAARARASHVE